MSDIPDGVTIESIFLVEVPYTPEARERRPRFAASTSRASPG
ncbi:MAG TPA: hypothetical protein VIM30_10300 [Candidatus Limnocylindrales bacterium]